MKTIISFFPILLYLMSGLAVAQTSVVAESPNQSKSKKVIIREYQYPATITCANSGYDSVTFIYTDASMQSYELVIRGYYVNDMRIVKDTLFFCGRKTGKGIYQGFIGYFKFDSRFEHIDSICLYHDFYVGFGYGNKVDEFTRMVTYTSSIGDLHVACVGECSNGIHPCLVDMYTNQYIGFWQYAGGEILNDKETLTDLKIINARYDITRKLVTSGFDVSSGQYINLRVYDPDDVFAPGGSQNMCHVFSFDPSNSNDWDGNEVLLSNVGNGIFSTASYRKSSSRFADGSLASSAADLNLAFFDLSPLISNSVYAMTQMYSVTLPTSTGKTINEYIFKSNPHLLVLLHTLNPATSNAASLFHEINYTSLPGYNAIKTYTNSDNIMQGLSSYHSNSNYVMSGYSLANDNDLKYEMETFGTAPLCAKMLPYPYKQDACAASVNQEKPFVSLLGRVYWEKVEFIRRSVPVLIMCEDGTTYYND